ncbi:phosphodiesterase [Actinophytocola xanthii]|uniref:Calcineurin-like phosphoesterase domain-containing protein n=1 Tax=Actinophytocola xanthii TaxID=1912961 RepID=A0A1Q8CY43_9PSEU|nr:phosphodiesterase [Actinophytocola xanthii]OLF19255.1 hypothetical protein BU204_02585 [Actinophytocola xanthii]
MLIGHLSDMHITTGPLAGAPAKLFHDALIRVQALDPQPACIVITGDLADHGDPDEYRLAATVLHGVDLPVHIVPGNHDNAEHMARAFARTEYVRAAEAEPHRLYYRVDYDGLRILFCDSSVAGRSFGRLGRTQLEWIDDELGTASEASVVLAMHHHPVRSGIAGMDNSMLADATELEAVLARHRPLSRILIGHLHRPLTTMFAGSVVTSAPSTYRQSFLGLDPTRCGAYVEEPPGFLLHDFGHRPALTHVVPVRSGPPLGRFGRPTSPR